MPDTERGRPCDQAGESPAIAAADNLFAALLRAKEARITPQQCGCADDCTHSHHSGRPDADAIRTRARDWFVEGALLINMARTALDMPHITIFRDGDVSIGYSPASQWGPAPDAFDKYMAARHSHALDAEYGRPTP